ncbi:GNAT family N-acetyltransferase [Blastopirellula marina]|uniref:GNAT family N-acetyltransferase n=1 Tax=Blastopirellula marina TaxID=124 RepID=UPI0003068247|nr:GNAT family N-acetyltransferase [Blastopirellula marina]
MTSKIRHYEDRDLEQLLEVWEAASELAHPFLTAEFQAMVRESIANVYLVKAETWVFEDNSHVVGFIALIGSEVGAIFVQPERQKLGIGRQLMDKAVQLRSELEVEVFVANSIGRAFYDRYGFVPLEVTHHEPTGQDVLRMRFPAKEKAARHGVAGRKT